MLSDLACRSAVTLASRIVPAVSRPDWRSRWNACLESLSILIARGELPGEAAAQIRWFCGGAFADALRLRGSRFDWDRWIRGPAFVLAGAAVAFLTLLAGTRGFVVTRSLASAGWEKSLPYLLPIAFAILSSIAIAFFARFPLRGRTWRYWSFLALKTAFLLAVVSLFWIEGGHAFRGLIGNETVRVLVGGALLAVAFIAAFGWTVLWSLSDQQRRCPVCLRRMAMPVRIGSWASIFEPVTTELLCEDGHGALCIQETETGEPDRWYALSSH